MPKLIGDAGASRVPLQMPDAAISQANPVTTQLYDVLPTPFTWTNVRIISITAGVTWANTQPNPLEVVLTIDGNTLIFSIAAAVSTTMYQARPDPRLAEANQTLEGFAFLVSMGMWEGRNVRVQVRVTFAADQPNPLVCRVKWARFP